MYTKQMLFGYKTQQRDPKWEGGWVVKKVHTPITLLIEHEKSLRSRVVHIQNTALYIAGEGEHFVKRG